MENGIGDLNPRSENGGRLSFERERENYLLWFRILLLCFEWNEYPREMVALNVKLIQT